MMGDSLLVVAGKVVDSRGTPISGATVELYEGDERSTLLDREVTTESGEYRCHHSYGVATATLVVRKDGYQEYSEVLDGSKHYHLNHVIILTPEK